MSDNNSDQTEVSDVKENKTPPQNSTPAIKNPYFENVASDDENQCDYSVPPPCPHSTYYSLNVPPPPETMKVKFEYTMKDGKKITLENPLPPDLPLDSVFVNPTNATDALTENFVGDTDMICCRNDNFEAEEVIFYALIALFPPSGLVIYYCIRNSNPKLAGNMLNAMMASLVIFGVILFAILYS
ncbi:hypothetical protein TVAG_331140 [Trichomonas vaginalis G3]|uniref:Uncharacterized protein n=1 Tax=Trichomonas vaginalis (strain ATCC PRA-98 / G3) TaxID=412133 RepID=A2FC33_TRIV3|nr:hypothetical protein TVAGG3_0757500 [Trichomonas vaginalis G3]EAX97528.1 hypothetical protein TVAG_331140 [Trichomonas vaginalis G3]KAI5512968.1 hypothetical protein TVAGG3_0757500 [Trichomonas vaginalis G3]|eukprot:XP_001310458.1 hypothetical protein [Trichomonas vaginalis G3]